ncbi:4726_t:CDS:2 [Funneliformis caledonium]|uniref:4726_t:CDS:1 n=1 Tax=Funneliformis caledonium TaxID=1117310 RepID=A0A9N9D3L6_9GLOM|nr:4726_t:CDS:2 [Funneliformis caledonium]
MDTKKLHTLEIEIPGKGSKQKHKIDDQIVVASADTIGSWILSSDKDIGEELSKYHENILCTKAYFYLAYFRILNLFSEDTEDFNNNIKLSDMKNEQKRPFYELMDKISKVLIKKPSDLITDIESCVIEDNIKVNTIRKLIQT